MTSRGSAEGRSAAYRHVRRRDRSGPDPGFDSLRPGAPSRRARAIFLNRTNHLSDSLSGCRAGAAQRLLSASSRRFDRVDRNRKEVRPPAHTAKVYLNRSQTSTSSSEGGLISCFCICCQSARFLLVALLTCLALPALAQLQTGNLYGTVTDDAGQRRCPGVTVTLTGTGAPQVQVDRRPGQVPLPRPRARAAISSRPSSRASRPSSTRTSSINIGRNTTIEVTLSPAVEDVITVTARERRCSTSAGSRTGATVSQTELEKIPTARDPWAVLQSTPGVLTDRINVGGNESGQQSQYVGPGSAGDQAIWAVDGVVITDMAALGSSPAYYDFDSFEEMQVTTGGSDATIATGGVVLNMVTKRGTNEWRGSGRYYVDDKSLAGRDLNVDQRRPRPARPLEQQPTPSTAFKQGNRIDKRRGVRRRARRSDRQGPPLGLGLLRPASRSTC